MNVWPPVDLFWDIFHPLDAVQWMDDAQILVPLKQDNIKAILQNSFPQLIRILNLHYILSLHKLILFLIIYKINKWFLKWIICAIDQLLITILAFKIKNISWYFSMNNRYMKILSLNLLSFLFSKLSLLHKAKHMGCTSLCI